MSDLSMRVIELSDAGALSILHRDCFPQAPWNQDFFEASLRGAATGILLQEDSKLKAFVFVNIVKGEADVLTICVAPDRRRQGLGKKLFKALFKEFDVHVCTLEVSSNNVSANKLYLSLGFEMCGERVNYYQKGVLVPEKALIYRYSDKS